MKTSTNFSGTKKSVFKTAPISSDMIIDKGFFTHHGDLTDNNRVNDNLSPPRFINAYNAQGSTYTFDETTWAGSSRNIYSSDGGLSTYITFIDSPTKNQIHSNPYYVNVNKTVTNKGNLAEIKFFDTEKILDKKINSYEQFRVKQLIAEKNLDSTANNPLPGTCSKTTSNTFTVSGLVGGEDWRKVMFDGSSAYEPVFIGTYYYTITGITAPSAGSQVVTIGNKRLITSNAFAGSAVLEAMSSAIAYRKTWSPVSQTYIAGHQIDTQISYADAITRNGNTVTSADSDVNGVEYLLENVDNEVFLEVEKGDKDTGYTKLTSRPASNFFASKYLNDSISGKLLINNPIFDGFVESRKADVKQAFKYEIVGRDSINKLLNTNLDKNYVHSEEFVYTTFNPYVGDTTSSTELEYVTLIANSISGRVITTNLDPTTRLSYGDTIAFDMNEDRYVVLGVVESTSSSGSNTVTLMKDCYIQNLTMIGSTTLNSNRIYRIRKSIIPHKNIETTPRTNNRATSLAGTLDKGIVFGSGREFSSTGDTNLLIQGKDTNVENGYNIDDFLSPKVDTDGNYLEFPLGFKTTLNIPSSTPDLEIVSSNTNVNGTVNYELAYVSPIVLGMVAKNENDKFITTGTDDLSHPLRLINGQGLTDGGFIHLLSSYTNSDFSPKTFNNIFSDDPSYTSTVQDQYALRYNQPIFRFANKQTKPNGVLLQPYVNKYSKKNYPRFDTTADLTDVTDILYSRNDYYENSSNFNYYLSAYKLNFKKLAYNKYTSNYHLKGLPNEQCGMYPVLGSKFFDINRVPHWFYSSGKFFGNRFSDPTDDTYESLPYYVGRMELHDPSALSMHLFSLGDVYPESKKNHNNIFSSQFTNRNLNDYSLLFKKSKTTNVEKDNEGYTHFTDTHSPNIVNVSNRIDSDYHTEPIVSSTGEQVRFNLMRLTDVTMDMLFNEVDYENVKVKNEGTSISKLAHLTNGGIGIQQSILIKSFSEAGLYYKDMTVTSVSSDLTRLNVDNIGWYNSTYNYYIYAYISNLDYPSLIGKVDSVGATYIDFGSSNINQLFNVEDLVLYVRTTYSNLDSFASAAFKNKMLLTGNSGIPHIKEDENVQPHNYLSTVIMVNSDGTTQETDAVDRTFSYNGTLPAQGSLLKTPMFVDAGTNEVIPTIRSTLSTAHYQPNFKMQIPATYTGNVITIAGSHNSELTKFFDLHQQTVLAISTNTTSDGIGSDKDMWFDGVAGLQAIGSSGATTWRVSGTSVTTDNVIPGMSFAHPGTSGGGYNQTYIIVRVTSSTDFEAYPAHTAEGNDTAWVNKEFKVSNNQGGFVSITGLQSGYDSNYIVTAYTDTTITLENIAGQGAGLPTQGSEVTLTIEGVNPDFTVGSATLFDTYTSASISSANTPYNLAWSTDVNGLSEPVYLNKQLNSIIPHRAWFDLENKIDITNLDQVFLNLKDTPEVLIGSATAILPNDTKGILGSVSTDPFTGVNEREIGYRKNTSFNNTDKAIRWNKGIFFSYANQKGPLSENYKFGSTQFLEKIFSGEVLLKPYISVTSSMIIDYNSSKGSGDQTLVNNEERILKFDIDGNPATQTGAGNSWVNYCNNLTGYYFRNGSEIHKVITHEINRLENNVFRHLLKLDNATTLGNGDKIYLMRINQVCMYDFSPKKILLNRAKVEYTKMPSRDEMQSVTHDATLMQGNDDGTKMLLDVNNDIGVKSMYLLIDPDGTNSNTFLETRNATKARSYNIGDTADLSEQGTRVLITDGINKIVTDVRKKGLVLEFSEIKKVLGTPSIGTTFTVKVNRSPSFEPETVSIGSSFKIVDELEKVIDDAFTINDITYTKDTEADTYFGAFNFTGQSLYSAANNLLSYKNKEILVDGEEIKIVDKEDSKKYRDIILSSKDSTYSITSINNDISLFDNFDEVIVIGDGVRGIARNPIDTSNSNRTVKSKQIYDYSILDQKQADLKAVQYLDVFNSANTSIEIEVADNVPFLKPGQIIELEFSEQNIPRGDYLVIEIEKEFGSPTKFTLSEYNKDLAGTFATLMGEIRNLQGFTKQKVYTTTTIPRTKRDKVNIKFVKATGTLTSNVTTTSTIGFGYTIGFDSEVGV